MYICILKIDIVFHFWGSKLFFSSWESVVATSARVDGGILGKHQCCGAMGHCLSSYKLVLVASSYRRHLKGIKPLQLQNIWWNRTLQIWLQCQKSLWAFTVFSCRKCCPVMEFCGIDDRQYMLLLEGKVHVKNLQKKQVAEAAYQASR